ncbi:aldo/keto reductase [Rhodococcus opacus]|nr:aldo/keto reductase [Rhodococcus opacus]
MGWQRGGRGRAGRRIQRRQVVPRPVLFRARRRGDQGRVPPRDGRRDARPEHPVPRHRRRELVKVDDIRTFGRAGFGVTLFGYGGAPIGNIFRPIPEEEAQAQITEAWNMGVRSFDTAPMYGHGLSEHRVGHALLTRDRDDYVLSTKVGRTLTPAPRGSFDTGIWVDTPPFRADFDYSYDAVLRQVEDSLQRMCQDRFDILYVHDVDRYTHGDAQPARFAEALEGAFPALIRLRDEGVVRAIGIGVNEADVCVDALERVDLDCVLLAGRYTLLEQDPVKTSCRSRWSATSPSSSAVCSTRAFSPPERCPAPSSTTSRHRRGAQPGSRHREVLRGSPVPLAAASIQFAAAHPAVRELLLGARNCEQFAAERGLARNLDSRRILGRSEGRGPDPGRGAHSVLTAGHIVYGAVELCSSSRKSEGTVGQSGRQLPAS